MPLPLQRLHVHLEVIVKDLLNMTAFIVPAAPSSKSASGDPSQLHQLPQTIQASVSEWAPCSHCICLASGHSHSILKDVEVRDVMTGHQNMKATQL